MCEKEKAIGWFKNILILDLPVGIFLLNQDGVLIDACERVRANLGLPLHGPIEVNFTDFICNETQKKEFFSCIREPRLQSTNLEDMLLDLCVGVRKISSRISLRVLRDLNTGKRIGIAGIFVDLTEEENTKQLLEHLPVGIFRVSPGQRLLYANDMFLEIFEIDSVSNNRDFKELFAYHSDILELPRSSGSESAYWRVFEMKRKNGRKFYASLRAVRLIDSEGNYDGYEGTIIDVTQEELFKRNLDDLPVGFYCVEPVAGDDIISQCNKRFADILQFDSVEQAIGFKVRNLYENKSAYDKFIQEIESGDTARFPLINYCESLKTIKGSIVDVEVHTRLIKDRSGNIVGRIGIIRDITEEKWVREQLEDLQDDAGRTFHRYSTALISTRFAIAPAITALDPRALEMPPASDTEATRRKIDTFRTQLARALRKLLENRDDEFRRQAFPQQTWDSLAEAYIQLTEQVAATPHEEFRLPWMRLIAREIIEVCRGIEKGIPQETIRSLVRSAEQLERAICIVTLRNVEKDIVEMDYEARSLRERILVGKGRTRDVEEVVSFWELVNAARNNLAEFANNARVDLRLNNNTHDTVVKVSSGRIVRALCNLLHNAIKYSWSREKGKAPWVDIRAYRKSGKVFVEFENYGVPVPADEIESDYIFNLGARGRLASENGRMGTGVGLYDSRKVARQYGGNVTLQSHPASPHVRMDDYTKPFLTVVVFSIAQYEE